jgi:hypothetical protein
MLIQIIFRDDYKYVTPILKKEAIDKEYLRGFEDLQKLLKRLQKTLSGPEAERNYVYLLPSVLCGIIVPAEVEEAIRNTALRDIVLLSEDYLQRIKAGVRKPADQLKF